MINQTIYLSYKRNIPYFVFNRWLFYNPSYKIDFSLDEDCIHFLRKEFNNNVKRSHLSLGIGKKEITS